MFQAAIPKATSLDLSCNTITTLPVSTVCYSLVEIFKQNVHRFFKCPVPITSCIWTVKVFKKQINILYKQFVINLSLKKNENVQSIHPRKLRKLSVNRGHPCSLGALTWLSLKIQYRVGVYTVCVDACEWLVCFTIFPSYLEVPQIDQVPY